MGVIYKLKPEIRGYIVTQKKANPILSCRSLVALVEKKFLFKISKSSINVLLKEEGLSMPVGRRRTKPARTKSEATTGIGEIKTALSSAAESLKLLEPQEKPAEKLLEKHIELPAAPKFVMPVEKTFELPPPERIEESVPPVKIEVPLEPVAKAPRETPPKIPLEIVNVEEREVECSGAMILKAADYLIGGAQIISEAIAKSIEIPDANLITKTEGLIYSALFDLSKENELAILRALLGKEISLDNISTYYDELQNVMAMSNVLSQLAANFLREVRCIKFTLSDKSLIYLDGQMQTVWSTPYTPYDFNASINSIKTCIDRYLNKDMPFTLLMAPGYDTPSKEFFNFLLALDASHNRFTKLSLSGNDLEELDSFSFEETKKRFFVFGLWPWQFTSYRKVNKILDYKPVYLELLKKTLYMAHIEIELFQPHIAQSLKLAGYAVKSSPNEKTRIVILSNLALPQTTPEELGRIYFSHWPNFEEAFHDYSHKIEVFTYTATARRYFPTEKLSFARIPPRDIRAFFAEYLRALDLYAKWHFLPSGLEDTDFPTTKKNLYDLKCLIKKENIHTAVIFQPPPGYKFLKELEYTCHRLNEREIFSSDGKKLWFSV